MSFFRRIGKQGGSTSGKTKREKVRAALGDRVAHLTPSEAFVAGARWQTRRLGAGLARRKFTEGYQMGWDACAAQFGLDVNARIRRKALAAVEPSERPTVRESQIDFMERLKEAI